jgi:hypothetical protein
MLLSFVHGGFLWLNRSVSIDIDLIVCITGISLQEKDPSIIFLEKKDEKDLSKSMKEKFHKL